MCAILRLFVNGIHALTAINRFSLVKQIGHLIQLPLIVEALFNVKTLITHVSMITCNFSQPENRQGMSRFSLSHI